MKLFLLGGFLGSGKTTAIQEADLLIVNQTDLIPESPLRQVRKSTKKNCPNKQILFQNSLNIW